MLSGGECGGCPYEIIEDNEEEQIYAPIEDYGIIGNLRSAALVHKDSSLDWYCFPFFDSPSVFGRILDSKKGGYFRICPSNLNACRFKQIYLPNTNILVSRFLSEDGVSQVSDFMPLSKSDQMTYPWIVRKLQTVRGYSTMVIECFPAFNYARDPHEVFILDSNPSQPRKDGNTEKKRDAMGGHSEQKTNDHHNYGRVSQTIYFKSKDIQFDLTIVDHDQDVECPSVEMVQWEVVKKPSLLSPGVRARINVREAQCLYIVARFYGQTKTNDLCSGLHRSHLALSTSNCDKLLFETLQYWRNWAASCSYKGRWREQVLRSALVLKLMTFQPTGAIVASPSCSLPEYFSGNRNWDYRYSWIRDSAFTLYAFLRIGFTEEADAYMKWVENRCNEMNPDGSLQTMYGIDGRHKLEEVTLDHLEGYRKSGPVRIGNHAYNQLQLDIYGELLDAIYLSNKYSAPISFDFWCHIRKMLTYVCTHWKLTDYGIWEVRGGPRNFVYSKIMCWVALDRGARLAEKRSFPSDRYMWIRTRDEIYEDIMNRGWSFKLNAFGQYYGSNTLDAANLIMPLVFFMSPNDPRFIMTLKASLSPPERKGLVSNNLCFRYNVKTTDDGLTGEEGTFSICSFWLIEAMSRAGRYDSKMLEEALVMFEQMAGYSNHLGLYSEQIAKTGELLGNFPQAFTHLSVISAAFNLDRILG